MTLHGTGCITQMSAAARAAVVAGNHIPGVSPAPPGPGGGRPPVTGGGHAPDTCHGGQTRFDPRASGGGGSRPATAPVVMDPAVTALAVLLGGSSLPEAAPSTTQRIVAQLAQLFAMTSERMSSMLAAVRESATADAPVADAGVEVPRAEVPRQPPPPPIGPVLTLDPSLGTIVEPEPVGGAGGLGDEEEVDPRYPTSWVPVTGALRGFRDGRWMQGVVERIDALLDEVGMTRLQLLLLTVLGPLAVAFLLDVVTRITNGG